MSIHCTKYFQTKTKDKNKTKQDICNKIFYKDAAELDYSDSEYNSSSMCMYNQILSIFYFNCFKVFLLIYLFYFYYLLQLMMKISFRQFLNLQKEINI